MSKWKKKHLVDDEDLEDAKTSFTKSCRLIQTAGFGSRSFSKPGKKPATAIYCDVACDDSAFIGMSNDEVRMVNIDDLETTASKSSDWRHTGLTCIRCSRTSPHIFYTSSTEGAIFLWDARNSSQKPDQKFMTKPATKSVTSPTGTASAKPIITFDVSCNDQMLCGGTELINEEDSYLFFWDVRSCEILGTYSESHSDDITAVKFHPSQPHSVASGSTDGLFNVYNLLEAEEDDALLYSMNTESSVEMLSFSKVASPKTIAAVVTHENEVQVWDSTNGDKMASFNRSTISKIAKRRNPEAVHVAGCYTLETGTLGLIVSSLSGNCTRLLNISEDAVLSPNCNFPNQSVVQTAMFLPKSSKWVMCSDDGFVYIWSNEMNAKSQQLPAASSTVHDNGRKSQRFHPYDKEKAKKK